MTHEAVGLARGLRNEALSKSLENKLLSGSGFYWEGRDRILSACSAKRASLPIRTLGGAKPGFEPCRPGGKRAEAWAARLDLGPLLSSGGRQPASALRINVSRNENAGTCWLILQELQRTELVFPRTDTGEGILA